MLVSTKKKSFCRQVIRLLGKFYGSAPFEIMKYALSRFYKLNIKIKKAYTRTRICLDDSKFTGLYRDCLATHLYYYLSAVYHFFKEVK